MKMKVIEKWTEQKNSGNANNKYVIKRFKRHISGAVDVAVAGVLLFVLYMRWFF